MALQTLHSIQALSHRNNFLALKELNPCYLRNSFLVNLAPLRRSTLNVKLRIQTRSALSQSNTDENSYQGDDASGIFSTAGLVMGTAIGPGILGLPSSSLSLGILPSSVTILASWVFVMMTIMLIVEVSSKELKGSVSKDLTVSFTSITQQTLGPNIGILVAVVYASLNYSLLVACIAGIGEIVSSASNGLFTVPISSSLCTILIFLAVLKAPFRVLDAINRCLCALLMASCFLLIAMGLPFVDFPSALQRCNWSISSMLTLIPVAVLTLGFHVITPLICSILKGNPRDSVKAVTIGGIVPLIMVLAWNVVLLGMAGNSTTFPSGQPLQLLLSVGNSARPWIQLFAFSALGTTLIGYALSFPLQLRDTVEMSFVRGSSSLFTPQTSVQSEGTKAVFLGLALFPSLILSLLCPTIFSSALDFAGVYANCFLFSILPPIMAWVSRYGNPLTVKESQSAKPLNEAAIVPGGKLVLSLLLIVGLFLGICGRVAAA